MKNNRIFFRGILVLAFLVFLMYTIFKITAPQNYRTFVFNAKETISKQQYQNTVDIIAQRMSSKDIKGKIKYSKDKLLLKIHRDYADEKMLEELFRRGKLAFADESGNILIDNSVQAFVETAEARKGNSNDEKAPYEVSVKFKEDAIDSISKIALNNLGKHLLIIMDNEVYTDPVISEKIPHGIFVVYSIEKEEQAELLEEILKILCLPCEFER